MVRFGRIRSASYACGDLDPTGETSRHSVKTCKYCGRENPDEAKACTACGSKDFYSGPPPGVDPYLISILPWYRRAHRKRLLAEPFPADWEALLSGNIAHYPRLSEEQKGRLRNDLRVLVTEKNWEGCDGLKMSDEIKVTISAQAALMLLGLKHDYFSQVLSIVVFPTAFEMLRDERDDEKQKHIAAGQAYYRGPVLLSWDQALEEGRDPGLGRNLVIHEFAHQLDFQDGYVNGIPVLRNAQQTARWIEVMKDGFARLQTELEEEPESFPGDHAGSNATEFFSVVSERFFTVPHELRDYNEEVYNVLVEYYGVNPLEWFPDV